MPDSGEETLFLYKILAAVILLDFEKKYMNSEINVVIMMYLT